MPPSPPCASVGVEEHPSAIASAPPGAGSPSADASASPGAGSSVGVEEHPSADWLSADAAAAPGAGSSVGVEDHPSADAPAPPGCSQGLNFVDELSVERKSAKRDHNALVPELKSRASSSMTDPQHTDPAPEVARVQDWCVGPTNDSNFVDELSVERKNVKREQNALVLERKSGASVSRTDPQHTDTAPELARVQDWCAGPTNDLNFADELSVERNNTLSSRAEVARSKMESDELRAGLAFERTTDGRDSEAQFSSTLAQHTDPTPVAELVSDRSAGQPAAELLQMERKMTGGDSRYDQLDDDACATALAEGVGSPTTRARRCSPRAPRYRLSRRF